MKKNIATLAAAVLAAAMTAAPAAVLAAETAAHVPNSIEEQASGQRLPLFKRENSFRGISLGKGWMRQAKLNGLLINLRLHTPMGDVITFREMLTPCQDNELNLCLTLLASSESGAVTMQMDQRAINTLNNLGIAEIVLADMNSNIIATYRVTELEAVREALGLTDGEQLCVTGEDAPVTVVGEDGVRREVNN